MAPAVSNVQTETILDLERLEVEATPSTTVGDDCLSFNPKHLSILTLIQDGKASYTVRDDAHWITNYPTFTDAKNAMEYMSGFNTICFTGRGTPRITFWFEKRPST
jgi:hypothetical protein